MFFRIGEISTISKELMGNIDAQTPAEVYAKVVPQARSPIGEQVPENSSLFGNTQVLH